MTYIEAQHLGEAAAKMGHLDLALDYAKLARDLQPQYICENCCDTGSVENGHPDNARACDCDQAQDLDDEMPY